MNLCIGHCSVPLLPEMLHVDGMSFYHQGPVALVPRTGLLNFFTVFLTRCSLAVSSKALQVSSLQIAVVASMLMPG